MLAGQHAQEEVPAMRVVVAAAAGVVEEVVMVEAAAVDITGDAQIGLTGT